MHECPHCKQRWSKPMRFCGKCGYKMPETPPLSSLLHHLRHQIRHARSKLHALDVSDPANSAEFVKLTSRLDRWLVWHASLKSLLNQPKEATRAGRTTTTTREESGDGVPGLNDAGQR